MLYCPMMPRLYYIQQEQAFLTLFHIKYSDKYNLQHIFLYSLIIPRRLSSLSFPSLFIFRAKVDAPLSQSNVWLAQQ